MPEGLGGGWRPPAGAVVGIRGTARPEGLRQIWPGLRDGLAAGGLRYQAARELVQRARLRDQDLAGCLEVRPESELDEGADLMLSVGGDGSLLAAVAELRRDLPVLGLHLGTRGYLTATTPEELAGCLGELVAGQLHEERRMMLRALVAGEDGAASLVADALNDVVISSGLPGRVVRLMTRIDDEVLFLVTGDGLIHATPTGSTAYNLGGGGPILDPMMEAIVLTPVMPHSVSVRPIVVAPGSRIETVVRSRHGRMLLSADGRLNRPLAEGSVVRVERSPRVARLLKRARPGFIGVLRGKLKWNVEE
jgi:NAD+ kinase